MLINSLSALLWFCSYPNVTKHSTYYTLPGTGKLSKTAKAPKFGLYWKLGTWLQAPRVCSRLAVPRSHLQFLPRRWGKGVVPVMRLFPSSLPRLLQFPQHTYKPRSFPTSSLISHPWAPLTSFIPSFFPLHHSQILFSQWVHHVPHGPGRPRWDLSCDIFLNTSAPI